MTAPIRAFVGFNGGGKTLAAMEYVIEPALKSGRTVYATNPIYDDKAHLLQSWRELATLSHCTVLLDEVTAALPSRQAMSMPAQLARVLNQLRKVDVELCWTAPSWARADKLLREVTQTVTTCRGMAPDKWERDDHGKILRVDGKRVSANQEWRPNRLFRFVTYAAADFDEFTISASRKLKAIKRQWYWRPKHTAHRLYGTLDAVQLLDHLDMTGACVICGGKRSAPRCSCPNIAPEAPAEAPMAPAPASGPLVAPEAVMPTLTTADAFASWDLLDQADDVEPEWVRAFWTPDRQAL